MRRGIVIKLSVAVPFPREGNGERERRSFSPFSSRGEGTATCRLLNFTKGETRVRRTRIVYQLRLLTTCR